MPETTRILGDYFWYTFQDLWNHCAPRPFDYFVWSGRGGGFFGHMSIKYDQLCFVYWLKDSYSPGGKTLTPRHMVSGLRRLFHLDMERIRHSLDAQSKLLLLNVIIYTVFWYIPCWKCSYFFIVPFIFCNMVFQNLTWCHLATVSCLIF